MERRAPRETGADTFDSRPGAANLDMARGLYRRYGKRWFDIVAAVLGFVLLAPLLTIVAAVVRWQMGRPILFRQPRPGLQGQIFRLVKFRSMTGHRNAQGEPLPDAERLTRFSRFLRSTSLDELPELWNVLRGEMSIVGPRPLLVQYLDRYTPEQARRHEVRPGITGWAQVNGRNGISWEDRFALDVWYVDHVSLWLDLRILCRTILSVVRRQGVSAAGEATMPEFRPSSDR